MEHLIDLVAEQMDGPKAETCFTLLDMHWFSGWITLDNYAV